MFHIFCVIDGILYTETWDTEEDMRSAVDVLMQFRECKDIVVIEGRKVEVY
jgi:hypothetical protein